ncbi:MAG: hypothetical protein GVY36_02415 [Verrucomicrobia bacterium]|jgi:hypothetical protein|nr:hypothetical protein [Verrucomicrobiota bacterium]
MSEEEKSGAGLNELEDLAARWDKAAYGAQGSPFENVSVAALAKNTGTRAWSRPGGGVKGDTMARYVYLSFEELMELEKLDLKSAVHLLEICEATFVFEEECNDLGSFEEIDNQAYLQRMRFVEEYGLNQDYPIALANLDRDLRELCAAEEIVTFVDLMEFLDRLSDKAWIGGSYRNLQNVFAHGDKKGLTKYFPFRVGHRGFHFPEALSFTLNRISHNDLNKVFEYHERSRRRSRLARKRMEMPEIVGKQLVPEVIQCLHYFCRHQSRLLLRLHDSAYVCRELMFLNDPQTEGVLDWLIHLVLGLLRPSHEKDIEEEVKQIRIIHEQELIQELRELLKEEVAV